MQKKNVATAPSKLLCSSCYIASFAASHHICEMKRQQFMIFFNSYQIEVNWIKQQAIVKWKSKFSITNFTAQCAHSLYCFIIVPNVFRCFFFVGVHFPVGSLGDLNPTVSTIKKHDNRMKQPKSVKRTRTTQREQWKQKMGTENKEEYGKRKENGNKHPVESVSE